MYLGVLHIDILNEDPEEMGRSLEDLAQAFAHMNLRHIQARGLPSLYSRGVRWARTYPYVSPHCDGDVCTRPERSDLFRSVMQVYATGEGDCKDLTAIRLAELWLEGEHDAQPMAIRYPEALGRGFDLFHLVVSRVRRGPEQPGDFRDAEGVLRYIEDPSVACGMQGVA